MKVRASQINGCAYCVDLHVGLALKARRAPAAPRTPLATWRESPFFSERERAALALTEALTRMDPRGRCPRSVVAGGRGALRRGRARPAGRGDRRHQRLEPRDGRRRRPAAAASTTDDPRRTPMTLTDTAYADRVEAPGTFDEVLARTRAALAEEGFGVLTRDRRPGDHEGEARRRARAVRHPRRLQPAPRPPGARGRAAARARCFPATWWSSPTAARPT